MLLQRVVHSLSSESFHKLKLKLTLYDSAVHLNPTWLLNDQKINPVWLHQEVDSLVVKHGACSYSFGVEALKNASFKFIPD